MSGDLTNLARHPAAYFESSREEMLQYVPQHARTTLEFGCGFGGALAFAKQDREHRQASNCMWHINRGHIRITLTPVSTEKWTCLQKRH